MPGKHAPASPASFVLSVARAVAAGLAALVFVGGIAWFIVASRTSSAPEASASGSPTASVSPSSSGSPSPSPSGTPASSASLRPRAAVSVVVLNGTTRQGLARKVAATLRAAGYRIVRADNGPATDATSILYRDAAGPDAEQLRRAQFSFLDPSVVVRGSSGSAAATDALVTVVIGSDYPAL